MNNRMEDMQGNCGYKEGALPACAPLAVGYVPRQGSSEPRYDANKALARGTLFPGLDLPLRNIVNTGTADVPLAELMALDFAAHDLALYLDTHADDQEAFVVYKEFLALAQEGRRKYAELYGPITREDLLNAEHYTWLDNPWPWDTCTRTEA